MPHDIHGNFICALLIDWILSNALSEPTSSFSYGAIQYAQQDTNMTENTARIEINCILIV